MLSKYGNCTRPAQNKKQAENRVFINKVRKNSQYFVGVFNKTMLLFHLRSQDMR